VNSSNEALRRARGTLLSIIVCSGLGPVAPAIAHHAFAAEYDSGQALDLSGVVTKAKWGNTHSWLYFDVKGTDGNVTNWGVELGAQIQVKACQSKNGGPFGCAVTPAPADGRSFQTGGAQDVGRENFPRSRVFSVKIGRLFDANRVNNRPIGE
jgi:hypothetical protein